MFFFLLQSTAWLVSGDYACVSLIFLSLTDTDWKVIVSMLLSRILLPSELISTPCLATALWRLSVRFRSRLPCLPEYRFHQRTADCKASTVPTKRCRDVNCPTLKYRIVFSCTRGFGGGLGGLAAV